MTVSYTGDVANASGFGCFNKILLKWKGSVYKLIYKVIPSFIIMLDTTGRHCRALDTTSITREGGTVQGKTQRRIFYNLYCEF